MAVRLAIVLFFAYGYAAVGSASDTIEIRLDESVRLDPLFEFVLPDPSSANKVLWGPRGLRFRLTQAPGNKDPKVVGFKFKPSVAGDFTYELDLECVKLEQPKQGWGHGLLVKFITADEDAPVVSFGCVATPANARAFRTNVTPRNGDSQRTTTDCDFSVGTWKFQRTDQQLAFAVTDRSGVTREISQVELGDSNLVEIQVWCTRLPEENNDAEFVLRTIRLAGDDFFGRGATASGGGGWRLVTVMLILNVIVVSVYVIKRVMQN